MDNRLNWGPSLTPLTGASLLALPARTGTPAQLLPDVKPHAIYIPRYCEGTE